MAGKTSGVGKKKPTVKKTSATRTSKAKQGKSPARAKTAKKAKGRPIDKTPLYVLAIMALLTVIVIMLVKDYRSGAKKYNIISQESVKTEKIGGTAAGKEDSVKEIKKETAKTDEQKGKDSAESVKDKKDKKEIAQTQYYIYLVRFNEKTEKMSLSPVKRTVKAESPIVGALNELIKGPNKNEKKRGLLTAVPENLKVRGVNIEGRNVVLDFNDAIETNANGEILLTRIDQLVYTATQFDGIDSVIIKVNGKQKKFLGGEGLSVSGPIGRKGR